LQFGRGELRWGRRRGNKKGEGRQSGDIFNFTDGITDEISSSVTPSAILTVNRLHHYTEIPV